MHTDEHPPLNKANRSTVAPLLQTCLCASDVDTLSQPRSNSSDGSWRSHSGRCSECVEGSIAKGSYALTD